MLKRNQIYRRFAYAHGFASGLRVFVGISRVLSRVRRKEEEEARARKIFLLLCCELRTEGVEHGSGCSRPFAIVALSRAWSTAGGSGRARGTIVRADC